MAVGTFNTPTTNITSPVSQWVRPSDWLAMPTPGTQELIGLLAIYDDTNYIAVQCQGAYTVDWGDGTTTNYASNAIASKTYAFSAISASTLTTFGYKQVLVRITPQAGQNLSSVAFNIQHPSLAKVYATGWLDIDARLPNGSIFLNGHTNIVRYARLERVVLRKIIAGSLMGNMFNNCWGLRSVYIEPNDSSTSGNFNAMFQNCYSLEEAPFMNTISATTMGNMFNQCHNLKSVPLYDTRNVTSMDSIFFQCRNLESIPPFNTSKVTNTNSMFQNCSSLRRVPLLDVTKVTLATSMFNSCTALDYVPALDFKLVTNFNSMFNTCISLRNIDLITTSASTSFNSMFTSCASLEEIPLLDTRSVTDFTNAFNSCVALSKIPQFNTSAATNFTGILGGCNSLLEIPALDTSKVITWTSSFANCISLRRLPALNFSAGTNFGSFLLNNLSLGKSEAYAARFAHSYTNMALSTPAIVEIFTNLGTANGAQTIIVSPNPGYAALTAADRLIATSKGWTIAA